MPKAPHSIFSMFACSKARWPHKPQIEWPSTQSINKCLRESHIRWFDVLAKSHLRRKCPMFSDVSPTVLETALDSHPSPTQDRLLVELCVRSVPREANHDFCFSPHNARVKATAIPYKATPFAFWIFCVRAKLAVVRVLPGRRAGPLFDGQESRSASKP